MPGSLKLTWFQQSWLPFLQTCSLASNSIKSHWLVLRHTSTYSGLDNSPKTTSYRVLVCPSITSISLKFTIVWTVSICLILSFHRKPVYFYVNLVHKWNIVKNAALQRRAMSIENGVDKFCTPAEGYVSVFHIPLRWSRGFGASIVYRHIAPLEQERFHFL